MFPVKKKYFLTRTSWKFAGNACPRYSRYVELRYIQYTLQFYVCSIVCCLCEPRAVRRVVEKTYDERNFRVPDDVLQYICAYSTTRYRAAGGNLRFEKVHLPTCRIRSLPLPFSLPHFKIRQAYYGGEPLRWRQWHFIFLVITLSGECTKSLEPNASCQTLSVNKVLSFDFWWISFTDNSFEWGSLRQRLKFGCAMQCISTVSSLQSLQIELASRDNNYANVNIIWLVAGISLPTRNLILSSLVLISLLL